MSLVAIITSLTGVVSLDFCADQYVLKLAASEDIAAVSRAATTPYSNLRQDAATHDRIRPMTEEIIARKPSLVMRAWGGGPSLAARLEKLQIETMQLDFVANFGDARSNISKAAAALGEESRGAALINDLDTRLAALRAKGPAGVTALYVTPGGVTAGAGTMIDAIFQAAGIKNAASEAGAVGWTPLPAEMLLLDPPKLIITGFFDAAEERTSNWSAARHPALARAFEATPVIHLPADLISCGTWQAIGAAELIRDAIDAKPKLNGGDHE